MKMYRSPVYHIVNADALPAQSRNRAREDPKVLPCPSPNTAHFPLSKDSHCCNICHNYFSLLFTALVHNLIIPKDYVLALI